MCKKTVRGYRISRGCPFSVCQSGTMENVQPQNEILCFQGDWGFPQQAKAEEILGQNSLRLGLCVLTQALLTNISIRGM